MAESLPAMQTVEVDSTSCPLVVNGVSMSLVQHAHLRALGVGIPEGMSGPEIVDFNAPEFFSPGPEGWRTA